MRTLIIAALLAVAAANPVPSKEGRRLVQPFYYTGYPLDYASRLFQPLPASISYEPASYVAALPTPIKPQQQATYAIPVKVSPEAGDQINVVLSVPSSVPPGTSLSVMVNVNSEPSGTKVSVSNPVLTPVAAPMATPAAAVPDRDDAVIVDAALSANPNEDEELGFRDPAILEGLVGFNNPKDSPELVMMQVQAHNEALAAKQKTLA